MLICVLVISVMDVWNYNERKQALSSARLAHALKIETFSREVPKIVTS